MRLQNRKNLKPTHRPNFKLFAIFLTILSLSHNAFATCDSYGCTDRILEITTTDAGSAYIKMFGDTSAVGCTRYGGAYFTIDSAAKNFSLLYSAVLLAQTMDYPIQVRTTNGSDGCIVSYVNRRSGL